MTKKQECMDYKYKRDKDLLEGAGKFDFFLLGTFLGILMTIVADAIVDLLFN